MTGSEWMAGDLHNVTFCRRGESASECFMFGDSLDIICYLAASPHESAGHISHLIQMCENTDQNHRLLFLLSSEVKVTPNWSNHQRLIS